MKKYISVILALVISASVFAFPVCAGASVSKRDVSETENVFYAGDKTIIYTSNSIFAWGNKEKKPKKIVSGAQVQSIISDGKTLLYSTDSGSDMEKKNIYSVSVSGKNMKKIKTVKGGYYLSLAAKYKNSLYYFNGSENYSADLYKMNLKTKKVLKVKAGASSGFCVGNNLYVVKSDSSAMKYTLYKVSLKTGKVKKLYNDASFGFSKYPYYYSKKVSLKNGMMSGKLKTLHYTTDGKKIKKVTLNKNYTSVVAVDGKNKFAVCENYENDKFVHYRVNLKTGKSTKITKGTMNYHKVLTDAKTGNIYLTEKDGSNLIVKKITKSKVVKLKSFNLPGVFYHYSVINGKFILIDENNYKIKSL